GLSHAVAVVNAAAVARMRGGKRRPGGLVDQRLVSGWEMISRGTTSRHPPSDQMRTGAGQRDRDYAVSGGTPSAAGATGQHGGDTEPQLPITDTPPRPGVPQDITVDNPCRETTSTTLLIGIVDGCCLATRGSSPVCWETWGSTSSSMLRSSARIAATTSP